MNVTVCLIAERLHASLPPDGFHKSKSPSSLCTTAALRDASEAVAHRHLQAVVSQVVLLLSFLDGFILVQTQGVVLVDNGFQSACQAIGPLPERGERCRVGHRRTAHGRLVAVAAHRLPFRESHPSLFKEAQ